MSAVDAPARAGRRAAAALLLAGALLPIVPLVLWSVSAPWRHPALVPQQTTLRGLRLLVDPRTDILRGLAGSMGIGAAVAVLVCLIGLPAGYAVGRYRFRGRGVVQFLLLAPVIVPGLAVTLAPGDEEREQCGQPESRGAAGAA